MKSVLISTRLEWCEKICHKIGTDKDGKPIYEKLIVVRKTKPSIPTPFKAFIYETYDKKYDGIGICWGKGKSFEHGCKKVIGEFICNELEKFSVGSLRCDDIEKLACLSYREMINYFYKPEELDGKTSKMGYAWHISDLKIYDKPKALWQFYKCGAKSFKELCDTGEICEYCKYSSHGLYLCEGRFCDETYEAYLDKNFTLTRPPQSWMYVEELEEIEK